MKKSKLFGIQDLICLSFVNNPRVTNDIKQFYLCCLNYMHMLLKKFQNIFFPKQHLDWGFSAVVIFARRYIHLIQFRILKCPIKVFSKSFLKVLWNKSSSKNWAWAQYGSVGHQSNTNPRSRKSLLRQIRESCTAMIIFK